MLPVNCIFPKITEIPPNPLNPMLNPLFQNTTYEAEIHICHRDGIGKYLSDRQIFQYWNKTAATGEADKAAWCDLRPERGTQNTKQHAEGNQSGAREMASSMPKATRAERGTLLVITKGDQNTFLNSSENF